MLFTRLQLAAIAVAFGTIAAPARASVLQQISNPVGMGADDSIAWSQLGGDMMPVTPPQSLTTTALHSASVSGPSALTVFDSSTYNADFLPGETVIAAFDINAFSALSDGIRIDLPFLVYAIGARVQVNAYAPFHATLEAFDASSTSLGTVSVNSTVLGNNDGSAPFLGGVSSSPIAYVVFTSDNVGLALDTVSLRDAPVPEPATFLLGLPAMLLLPLRRKPRR